MKIKSLLVAGILSSSLYAGNYYVGFGGMSGSATQTYEYNGDSTDNDYDMNGVGVKFGFITSSKNRIEIDINQLSGNNDDSYTGYEVNYLITFLKQDIQPYIGLGIGAYQSDDMTGYNIDTGETENASALSIGASIGILYSITSNIEIEAAYQFRHLEWNYVDFDLTDDINNVYIGGNFKF